MTRLRENTGVILWILVFAFGVIWVLQDSGGLENIGAQQQDGSIAHVDGDRIMQQEYQDAIDAQTQQIRQQTGQQLTPEQQDQLRESVYNQLIEDRLREQQMRRLGITVTDDEVADMILGDDPHPIIRTYFGDEQGNVDRQLLMSFANNPEARQDWIQMEEFLRSQRRQEKLQSLLNATIRVSEREVEKEYERRNTSVDIDYLALPYADVPSGEIEVTEDDLRDFYDEHREEFSRERTYHFEYVTETKAPTPEDTAQVRQELEDLRADFVETENDSLFLQRHSSQRPYDSEYQSPADLDPELVDVVFDNPQSGEIIGPVFSRTMAHLIKIQDVRTTDLPYVRARHIVIEDAEDAPQRAQVIMNELEEGADFAALARQHSADAGAQEGGDLGWFGPGDMPESFEQAAFDASEGEIVGPVQTEFGWHIIEVQDRVNQEVQMADLAYDMRPTPATLLEIEDRLDDVAYYAVDGDFHAEAEQQNLEVQQGRVEQGQEHIPQVGSSRLILEWLDGASRGDVSEVIEMDERFIVLHLTDIERAGYEPFEDVQAEIRPRVERQKRIDYQRERLQDAIEQHGSLDEAAAALDRELLSYEGLQYNTRTVPQIGQDRRFVGTALGLSEGATSRAKAGQNAAYVIRSNQVHEPEPIDQVARQQIRQELEQQRRQQVQERWIASLREQADIEDRRQPRQF